MNKINEKTFINIVSNVIICLVIVCVALIGFYTEINDVFNNDVAKPYYNGNTSKKQVSIMINVYSGSEYIEQILSTLDKYKVKATFFIGGVWAQRNEKMLLAIYDSGNEIANHGYFHKDAKQLNYIANKEEIYNCQKMIFSICGANTSLYAPPSGSYGNTVLQVASDLNYQTIMWSKDTIDWRDQDSKLIFSRATKKLSNGDLVLMHPTKCTALTLDSIIAFYINNGFDVVKVSKNII